jgi:hypothetical protein
MRAPQPALERRHGGCRRLNSGEAMSPDDQRTTVAEIAAMLEQLRNRADAAGQPFLAYMIEMARLEAERAGG